jgi:hypothetical protein
LDAQVSHDLAGDEQSSFRLNSSFMLSLIDFENRCFSCSSAEVAELQFEVASPSRDNYRGFQTWVARLQPPDTELVPLPVAPPFVVTTKADPPLFEIEISASRNFGLAS